MVIYKNQLKYFEYEYKKEEDFENDIIKNSESFFGTKSLYIDTKKKIKSQTLGNTIPDGFLIDLSDENNPEFYIVEAELYKHDFYSHIFPQLTKFFAFFKNIENRRELVDKLYTIINEDKTFKSKIKKYTNQDEMYKYISDMIENSQNILLIIDEEKKELPEIMNTYTDTWGKMVKVQIIKKFITENEEIFTMEPEFEAIEYSLDKNVDEVGKQSIEISEDFHLDNKSQETKDLYLKFKDELLNINKDLIFNPQKYYISVINERNILFFKIRKKKIRLVIMMNENIVRENIKHHKITTLSESVQKFYNGKCTTIDIENDKNFSEIISLLQPLLVENN